ncbi:MFS transporter [Rhodopila sp.]|uniref:MFS transporter n=1 Tax=Rhodopila sp. TaxID=2480087 RepID=UPI003D0A976F
MSEAIANQPVTEDYMPRTIIAGVIGNMVEWYDWTVYGLLAGVFSHAIFPAQNPTSSVISALLTFAVGFLMRPVGSIVLSPLADRYGRRQILSLTILLMGFGSLLIAVVPPYASIGIASPLIVLVARLLQGFSTGAEFQSSTVYLVEHAPAERRAFVGSSQLASIGFAVLVATGVATLTTTFVPQPALETWAWRIPFLFGALLSLYGMWMRLRLPETPFFVAIEQRQDKAHRPIFEALREYPASTLYVFCVQIGTVMFYLWTVFLPTYANLVGKLPLSQGLLGGTISLAAFTVAVPVMAALSDRVGRKPLLIGSAVGFLVLARPLFFLLGNGDFASFLLADIVGCLLLAMVDGVMPALFCELFPTRVRTSGIGIPYQVCSAIFSGTAPLVAAWFIHRGEPLAVTWYVMAIGLLTGIVFCFMPETRGRSLG